MIIDALLSILSNFLNFILTFFTTQSDVPATNAITSSIIMAATYYRSLDSFFPVTTLLLIIAFELTFEGIYFIYKMIRWGYTKIPGVN